MSAAQQDYDWIIIGSGFGGSVSALRLAEKGYKVLVIEKGKRFAPQDFPKTNWDLKRWLWKPSLGLRGFFQMSFLKHVTVYHGVGVGGGSLVYANTLPTPKTEFFKAASWGHLADWQRELEPHYHRAKHMLGAARNPVLTKTDEIVREIAEDIGRGAHFEPTEVAVFFGEPNKKVPDPYFGGKGPDRVGCTFCGACMTGCRVGAKNTLDQNYLYLAEHLGVEVKPETEVIKVSPATEGGYQVETKSSFGHAEHQTLRAKRVIFAGGVLGTIPLLLRLKEDETALPELSDKLGDFVRTNSESLLGVITPDPTYNLSKGVAISSIVHTDEHSHFEPVRYGAGSGFFSLLVVPHVPAPQFLARLWGAIRDLIVHPLRWFRIMRVADFAKQSQILLYMRTLEGTLSLKLGRNIRTGFRRGLVTDVDDPKNAPAAFMKEATDIASRFAEKIKGSTVSVVTEMLFGVPSTAHILGGACMGESREQGVINHKHEVFGYPGLYVIDGSAVSANPGVNPSLTITALAERAMTFIPQKAVN